MTEIIHDSFVSLTPVYLQSEESGRELNSAIESLTASLISVECTGCSRTYSQRQMVITIQKDTVEAVLNKTMNSNLTVSFGDVSKDTQIKFVVSSLCKTLKILFTIIYE